MIIDACPGFVQALLGELQPAFTPVQYRHLWSMVLAIAVNWRASKVCHVAGLILGGRHRTSLGDFLRDSVWNESEALAETAWRVLGRMKPRPGETIDVIIDDTRIAKRGKQMACVQKIWDHKQQRFVRGHIVVVAAIRFRGVVLPWRIVLWKPRAVAGRGYRTSTAIAAEMIGQFAPPAGLKVRVLFDAFYLCPLVTHACESRGFCWFSVAARNRLFTREGGRGRRIGDAAPGWVRHLGKIVHMPRSRGRATLRIAQVNGHLSRIGRVRLVVSKRPRDPWRNLTAFATNACGLNARTIVSVYEGRWTIEVLFKELRTDLGFGDYQVMDERAIDTFTSALAHQLLTHHAMDGLGAQARKANMQVALPPLSQRLDALRLSIRRDQLHRLLRGSRFHRVRAKLEPYLLAA